MKTAFNRYLRTHIPGGALTARQKTPSPIDDIFGVPIDPGGALTARAVD